MKAIIVLTFDLPDPEAVPAVLTAINPPSLPYFAGTARIAVEPVASRVEQWLDQ